MSDGRDWGGVRAAMNEAKAVADAEIHRMHSCPLCGRVLDYSARRNLLNCPAGHFRTAPGPGYEVN